MGLLENNIVRVILGLVIGLAVIMYLNPPRTVCTAQTEIYNDGLKGLVKPFSKALSICKEHPEPGGCVGFFDVLGKIETRFNEISRQCQVDLKTDEITRSWIATSMELFTLVAWGSKPPPSYLYRNGWLELTQIAEFCRLKNHLQRIYGQDAWTSFVGGMMSDLPGAGQLSQTDIWNRSLLSDPCQYPL